jgi:hypothetical protein
LTWITPGAPVDAAAPGTRLMVPPPLVESFAPSCWYVKEVGLKIDCTKAVVFQMSCTLPEPALEASTVPPSM